MFLFLRRFLFLYIYIFFGSIAISKSILSKTLEWAPLNPLIPSSASSHKAKF